MSDDTKQPEAPKQSTEERFATAIVCVDAVVAHLHRLSHMLQKDQELHRHLIAEAGADLGIASPDGYVEIAQSVASMIGVLSTQLSGLGGVEFRIAIYGDMEEFNRIFMRRPDADVALNAGAFELGRLVGDPSPEEARRKAREQAMMDGKAHGGGNN